MTNLSIQIDDSAVSAALSRLQHAAVDLAPAMRKIAQGLLLEVERNFEAQGRPRWEPLSDVTKLARVGGAGKAHRKNGELKAAAKRQINNLRILQYSGQLAASVDAQYDSGSAIIGSNKVYAAIQHFGGEAGRNKSVTLPARPWLPLTTDKQLQPEAREGVLNAVLAHLKVAASG